MKKHLDTHKLKEAHVQHNYKLFFYVIIIVMSTLVIYNYIPKNIFNDMSINSFKDVDIYINNENTLKVHYIDVGQADAILIQQGTNAMLIDGGNNEDESTIINYLDKYNVTKLNYVIGTHAHEDHIGSLDKVIDKYEVYRVLFSKHTATTKTFEDFALSVKNKGLKLYAPKSAEVFDLGSAKFEVLAPISVKYEDTNNYSIVIKLVYGKNTFLFTGDMEELSESELLKSNLSLEADVLKIAHHGSSSSTSKEFLNRVTPKYAVISVGKDNTYGHPHKEVLNRLSILDIPVYRTDVKGNIKAISDGNNITFEFGDN